MNEAESKSPKKAALIRVGQSAINCVRALDTLQERQDRGAGLPMTPQRLVQYVIDLVTALTELQEKLPLVEDTLNQASRRLEGVISLVPENEAESAWFNDIPRDNAVRAVYRLGVKFWIHVFGGTMRTPFRFTGEDLDVGWYEQNVRYTETLRQILNNTRKLNDPEALEARVRNEVELAISIIENAN